MPNFVTFCAKELGGHFMCFGADSRIGLAELDPDISYRFISHFVIKVIRRSLRTTLLDNMSILNNSD